jgi:hypothetical protein
MAELFGVDVRTVNEHLRNIFASEELNESSRGRLKRETFEAASFFFKLRLESH